MLSNSLKSEARDATPSTRTRCVHADATSIAEAAQLLRAGGLVALPTETLPEVVLDAGDIARVACRKAFR